MLYLNTMLQGTCSQGSVPVIGVDARSPADIQAAVNLAVQYNPLSRIDMALVIEMTVVHVRARSLICSEHGRTLLSPSKCAPSKQTSRTPRRWRNRWRN
ncbi:hypothetical protein F5I97DRAFT_1867328 [Phlebopus sp. FC_14]|nr:hypothetical protein F5I97DRAFT_1867328 [Phlebopus sp. FC_14]